MQNQFEAITFKTKVTICIHIKYKKAKYRIQWIADSAKPQPCTQIINQNQSSENQNSKGRWWSHDRKFIF